MELVFDMTWKTVQDIDNQQIKVHKKKIAHKMES